MIHKFSVLVCFLFLSLSLAACGPSAEEVATMTASAWTATPPPTPTPTPIPYNMILSVTDPEGNPIVGASVAVNGETTTTDDNGSIILKDLPGDSVSLAITSPGYFSTDMTETIERGDNQLSIVMEPDPNGLLPANACTPNEKLIYIDDFQDGIAQEWDSIEGGAPGWAVEADPENPDDMVVAAREGAPWAWLGGRETYNFNNTVWRLRFKYTGSGDSHINFRFVEREDLVRRYILALGQEARLGRFDPSNHLELGTAGTPQWDQWHLLEYSYYEGTVSVYIDGQEGTTWTDTQPWEGGTLNLEPMASGDTVFYYDDFSVCELSAPFEPIPRPETGYNLTVSVADAEGNPVPSASVTVAEMSNLKEGTQQTDVSGMTSWLNLPGESVTLQVNTLGYFSVEEALTIEKGDNEISIALERDQFGKLPSEACRPEEQILYVEDVQDGLMQGWDTLQRKIDLNVPGWVIIPEPEQEGNLVLQAQGQGDNTHSDPVGYERESFGNSVIRFEAKGYSQLHYILRWHMPENDFNNSYLAFIYADNNTGGRMEKLTEGNYVTVFQWNKALNDGNWHTFEIASYQGENQIWIDGSMMGRWTDPEPISEGLFTIEHDFWKGDAYAYYDNFSVCGLSAPFVSILAEE